MVYSQTSMGNTSLAQLGSVIKKIVMRVFLGKKVLLVIKNLSISIFFERKIFCAKTFWSDNKILTWRKRTAIDLF